MLKYPKKGLEISVLALNDVASAMACTLDVTQTLPKLATKGEEGYTRINFYIEQIFDCLDHLSQVNLVQLLKINDPTITSMNTLMRKAYNTRIVQNLLHQLCLEPEFDIFHPHIQNVINLGANF